MSAARKVVQQVYNQGTDVLGLYITVIDFLRVNQFVDLFFV